MDNTWFHFEPRTKEWIPTFRLMKHPVIVVSMLFSIHSFPAEQRSQKQGLGLIPEDSTSLHSSTSSPKYLHKSPFTNSSRFEGYAGIIV